MSIKHFSIMWILPEHSFKRVQTIFIAHVVDSTLKNFLSTPKFKFEHEIKFSIWNCWCLHIHSFIQSCSSVYRSIYRLIWIHLNFLLESTYLLCADDVLLVTRHKNHNSVISKADDEAVGKILMLRKFTFCLFIVNKKSLKTSSPCALDCVFGGLLIL